MIVFTLIGSRKLNNCGSMRNNVMRKSAHEITMMTFNGFLKI